jgi:carboxyl-terminal processing protease
VLINGGTRSGKEWVAFLLAEAGRTLVGTRTRGAFLGGRPYLLGGGKYLLYLAVNWPGPKGVNLEGVGVAPRIEVSQELPYSAGADPQLERALDVAAEEAATALSRSFPRR